MCKPTLHQFDELMRAEVRSTGSNEASDYCSTAGLEIVRIAIPAALALAADPVASLIDTVFIGHIGAVELVAVGASIAIFNQASKITVYPLVGITTSFVAEEETVSKISAEVKDAENQAQRLKR